MCYDFSMWIIFSFYGKVELLKVMMFDCHINQLAKYQWWQLCFICCNLFLHCLWIDFSNRKSFTKKYTKKTPIFCSYRDMLWRFLGMSLYTWGKSGRRVSNLGGEGQILCGNSWATWDWVPQALAVLSEAAGFAMISYDLRLVQVNVWHHPNTY